MTARSRALIQLKGPDARGMARGTQVRDTQVRDAWVRGGGSPGIWVRGKWLAELELFLANEKSQKQLCCNPILTVARKALEVQVAGFVFAFAEIFACLVCVQMYL